MNLGAIMREIKRDLEPWSAIKAATNRLPSGSLHLFIIFNLAIAQPLFDVLARGAPFFVATRAQPMDIAVMVLLICILLPALFIALEIAASLVSQKLRVGIHTLLVAVLLATIALPAIKRIGDYPGIAVLFGAGLIGIVGVAAYSRFDPVRQFLTFASIGVLVIPTAFLLDTDIAKIVFPGARPSSIEVEVNSTIPVVMVIFDELPVTSLMDEQRQIDPIRYPSFAGLAKDAHWFRNATTVADHTHLAVPAILTGRIPREIRSPSFEDHPNNLFTLLGNSYEMRVFESLTSLCPRELCNLTARLPARPERMLSMFLDVGLVYLHIILPDEMSSRLPPIDRQWHGFFNLPERMDRQSNQRTERDPDWQDHPTFFASFVNSIENSEDPRLNFVHIRIPHAPWRYLPNGKSIVSGVPAHDVGGLHRGSTRDTWSNNEWLVIQGFQRHLLQVGFADKLLGDLIARMKAVGVYERSLVIVMADHGASFSAGVSRRHRTDDNLPDILPVPLLVKMPHQDRGMISDRNVQTVDIVPTIAEVLDVVVPWSIDGRSLFDTSLPDRTQLAVVEGFTREAFAIAPVSTEMYRTLDRKLAAFGSGERVDGLYVIGQYAQMIGRDPGGYPVDQPSDVRIWLDGSLLWENVDTESDFVPARITGQVVKGAGEAEGLHLAVAVNGTIQAVTQTFAKFDDTSFSAIVPERSFRKGYNRIEFFLVSGPPDRPRLQTTINMQTEVEYYSISKADGRESIKTLDGESFPIVPGAVGGVVEQGSSHDDIAAIKGWAADIRGSQPAESVLVVVNGRITHVGWPHLVRSDVAAHFGKDDLVRSGFRLTLPLGSVADLANAEIRVIAISSYGVASELTYGEGYAWGKRPNEGAPAAIELSALESSPRYSLSTDGDGDSIVSPGGEVIAIVTDVITGTVDQWRIDGQLVFINGWAVDVLRSQQVETVLLFANGEFVSARETNFARPDVAKVLGKDELMESGFDFVITSEQLGDLDETEIRVFALTKNGEAQELAYSSGFPWARTSDDSTE